MILIIVGGIKMLSAIFSFVSTLVSSIFWFVSQVLNCIFSLPLWLIVVTDTIGTLAVAAIVYMIFRKKIKAHKV